MSRPNIAVIGGGFVGSATARAFMEHADVRVYDVLPERRTHDLTDALADANFVFVCLPTPMVAPESGDYECNLTYVEGFFDELLAGHRVDAGHTLVLKSTVPVGTTARLAKRFDRPILHSPEFLTARCSLVDAQTPARNIVGAPPGGMGHGERLVNLYARRFPGVPVFRCSSDESELAKLACNAFFATKVSFFNEISAYAAAIGVDWDTLRSLVLSDGRIAHAHTAVPGPDGKRGFGGTCLPKDLRNLTALMQDAGITPHVLSGAWERNYEERQTEF